MSVVLSRSMAVEGVVLDKHWDSRSNRWLIQYLRCKGSKVIHFDTSRDRGNTIELSTYKTIVKLCPNLEVLNNVPSTFLTEHAMQLTRSGCPQLRCMDVILHDEYDDKEIMGGLKTLVNDKFPSLRVLSLPLVVDTMEALKVVTQNCVNLESLTLFRCTLTFEGESRKLISILDQHCKNLRVLLIDSIHMTDADLRALAVACPQLRKLGLYNPRHVTTQGYAQLSQICLQLTDLSLMYTRTFVETPPPATSLLLQATMFSQLQQLFLSDITATYFCDQDICNLAASCPQLVDVDFERCMLLTDVSICALSIHCRGLKKLRLNATACGNVSFSQLAVTSTGLTHFEFMPNGGTARVERSFIGLDAMFTHCVKLEFLTFRRVVFTPESLEILAHHCTKLQRFCTDLDGRTYPFVYDTLKRKACFKAENMYG